MKISIQGKLNEIKNFSRDNKICISILFVQIIAFYFMLSNMGFGTHDEIYQYITHSNPEWKFNTNFSGRFMPIIGQIMMYLQFNASSFAIYRIYTMIGLLLGVGASAIFVKHHISENDWLKYVIIFFACLQITDIHSGAIAFDMTYQYRMFYCFTFLDQYLLFCKTNKKRHLYIGSFFWLVAINSYEAYYAFCVILFIVTVITLKKREQLTIRKVIQYLWLPALIAVISLIVYILRTNTGGQVYNGATISSNYGLLHKIKSILIYTFGNWPLRLNNYSVIDVLKKITRANYESLFIVIKNILIAMVVCLGARIDRLSTDKQWWGAVILSAMSALLVSCLVGVTEQYCSWAFESGVISAQISFYSYFFIIIGLFLMLGKIKQIKNKFVMYIVRCCVFLCVFFVGVTTEINNMEAANRIDKTDNKYVLFDAVIQSEYFASIEENAIVYAPEMLGVHYNLDYLTIYCRQNYGKEVVFCNQLSEVDFNKNVYMLRYISENDVMVLGNIKDERLETGEIYVIGMHDFSQYSLCFSRDVDDNGTEVVLNDIIVGVYGDDVAIPLQPFAGGMQLYIQTEVISMKKINFLKGTVTDNAMIRFEYGEGVHQQENFGRWVATNSCYAVYYKGHESVIGTAYLTLSTATGLKGTVEIEVNGVNSTYEVCDTPVTIPVKILLQNGENRINLSSKVQSMDTLDARDINLKLTEAYGIFKEVKYKFY